MERYLTDSEYYLNLTKGLGRRSFAELCYTCTILHWASWFCFSRARLCAARYFMIPNQDWFGSTPGSCPLFITQTGVPQLPPSSSKSLHCSIMLHHSPPPEVTFELWGLIEDTTWKQTSEQHSLSTFATSEDRVKNWGRGCGTRSCSSVQLSRSPGKLTELTNLTSVFLRNNMCEYQVIYQVIYSFGMFWESYLAIFRFDADPQKVERQIGVWPCCCQRIRLRRPWKNPPKNGRFAAWIPWRKLGKLRNLGKIRITRTSQNFTFLFIKSLNACFIFLYLQRKE